MKIIMPAKTRKKLEDDLRNANPFHEYWIEVNDNQLIIEFLAREELGEKEKIYRFEIEEGIK